MWLPASGVSSSRLQSIMSVPNSNGIHYRVRHAYRIKVSWHRLTRADFAQALIKTLIVSTSAALLSLCVGVPAAYAFVRFPFTGRTFLFCHC
jgi:ABC-type glycerol-3-phosphate transport system permease component